jgi:hypothetical protein
MNYGTCHFFDRFKYVIVGSTLGFDLMFIIETMLFLPHNDAIGFCSPMHLFGTNYAMFAEFLAVSVSGMIIFYCDHDYVYQCFNLGYVFQD